MKAEQVNEPQWEDIIFASRNKAYGAYSIRKEYSKHVVLGSVITVISVAALFSAPYVTKWIEGQQEMKVVEAKSIKYTELAPPPPIQNTPPPPKMEIPPPVKTIIKFLPPKVTEKEVAEEEEMPTIDEIKVNEVGSENTEGEGKVEFNEPVEEVMKEENEDDKIFTIVEQSAEYPGGTEAMIKFLQKNMKYPAVARRMNIEGSVFVSFVIDKEGVLSEIQVIKGISAECDKEAARVIKLMPPWKPGKQNGKAVRCRFVLPVKFKLAS